MTTYIATINANTTTKTRKANRAAKLAAKQLGIDVWTERTANRSSVAFAIDGYYAADRETQTWAQACISEALAAVGL